MGTQRSRPPRNQRQIERDAEVLARLVLAEQPAARDEARRIIEQLERRQHRQNF